MKNVALITGASSGIGKDLAFIHAEQKGDLVIVARRQAELEALKSEIEKKYGVEVKIIVKDLTKPDAPQEIYNEIKQDGIHIEHLINNAGFGGLGKFHERDWKQDEAMINLNIMALTSLTRIFLPDFVKRNSGQILNVSSTASLMPGPLQAVYFATKAYVTSFSNAIAEELHDTKVTVTALLPGATATEFGKISGMDKTSMFQNTVSARMVAEDGYKAMMKGKLIKVSGLSFSQKLMMSFIPVTPLKMLLKQIRGMQEV
ncbi:MAG: SDR family NAD(P)-dependent oxidoreductase [Bacteroidales bacterium]|nr:SDR family NAD(P)-dependent oxidoreductase [Bacteroidales bacterium]